jgi:hypothetical protein
VGLGAQAESGCDWLAGGAYDVPRKFSIPGNRNGSPDLDSHVKGEHPTIHRRRTNDLVAEGLQLHVDMLTVRGHLAAMSQKGALPQRQGLVRRFLWIHPRIPILYLDFRWLALARTMMFFVMAGRDVP